MAKSIMLLLAPPKPMRASPVFIPTRSKGHFTKTPKTRPRKNLLGLVVFGLQMEEVIPASVSAPHCESHTLLL
jgi:hypothetical protein